MGASAPKVTGLVKRSEENQCQSATTCVFRYQRLTQSFSRLLNDTHTHTHTHISFTLHFMNHLHTTSGPDQWMLSFLLINKRSAVIVCSAFILRRWTVLHEASHPHTPTFTHPWRWSCRVTYRSEQREKIWIQVSSSNSAEANGSNYCKYWCCWCSSTDDDKMKTKHKQLQEEPHNSFCYPLACICSVCSCLLRPVHQPGNNELLEVPSDCPPCLPFGVRGGR